MIAKCTGNNLRKINEKLINYAFGQDEEGDLDLTIGKEYKVYGIRTNDLGKFYLVLTDEVNKELPWWIPADLFMLVDENIPSNWSEKTFEGEGTDTIFASSDYHAFSEEIEDGTAEGKDAFQKMQY